MLAHELWPVFDLEDRVCGSCPDVHTYEQHVIDLRWMRVRCAESGCPCREFVCQEHPGVDCVTSETS